MPNIKAARFHANHLVVSDIFTPLLCKCACNSWIGSASILLPCFAWRPFPDSLLAPFDFISRYKMRKIMQPKPRLFSFAMSKLVRLNHLRTFADVSLHDSFRLFKSNKCTSRLCRLPNRFTKQSALNAQRTIPVPMSGRRFPRQTH